MEGDSMREEGEMDIGWGEVDFEGGSMMEEKQILDSKHIPEPQSEHNKITIYDYSNIQLTPREGRKPKLDEPQPLATQPLTLQ